MQNAWEFYTSPKDAWEAMYAECEAAIISINFEQYLFEPEGIGERFARLFCEKARHGVRVRLLVDGIGSFGFASSPLVEMLREAGVEVRFFNRLHIFKRSKFPSYFLRDHRKLTIIDGRIGFLGGVCIASRMERWRDTHIRLSGSIVEEMLESFETMWNIAVHFRRLHFPRRPLAGQPFRLLDSSPRPQYRDIYQTLLRGITEARSSVYLSTAYFIPSFRMRRALVRAARRGVDVRVILPEHSDVPIADIAAWRYFARLLRAGVRIFRYKKTMFHAKTAVIDDTSALVGSANLDNLSLLLNYEIGVFSAETGFVADVKKQFLGDQGESEELSLPAWQKRPLLQKCKELLVWPIHGIL